MESFFNGLAHLITGLFFSAALVACIAFIIDSWPLVPIAVGAVVIFGILVWALNRTFND